LLCSKFRSITNTWKMMLDYGVRGNAPLMKQVLGGGSLKQSDFFGQIIITCIM
jgi:hypothetical protein